MSQFIDPRTGKPVRFTPPVAEKEAEVQVEPEEYLTLEVDEQYLNPTRKLKQTSKNNEILNKTFVNTTQFVAYIITLIASNKIEDACDIYSHAQQDIGYLLINRLSGDDAQMKRLANMLFKARDFDKAAMVCEQIEVYDKAALLYEKSDDYRMAAECYLKTEAYEKAAEMFEKNRNHNEAAELFNKIRNFERAAYNYEKSVDLFVAGKLYYKVGNFKKSMELFQKINSNNDHFLEAGLMIGRILAENGYHDLAIKKLEAIRSSEPIDERTKNLYHELAVLYMRKNDLKNGQEVFEKISNYQFDFQDSVEILKEIARGENRFITAVDNIEIEVDLEEEPPAVAKSGYVSVMEGFEYLSTLPLFAPLSLSELKQLYQITETIKFSDGDYLIKEDQPGEALFIVRSGFVDVLSEKGGTRNVFATLPDGVHVGEMSLFDESKTSASVVAKDDVLVFKIPKTSFNKLLSSNDCMARKVYLIFIKTLSERLRETNEKISR